MEAVGHAVYAAKIRNEFVVVGHCVQYAVIRDEEGALYYTQDENRVLEEGTVCDGSDLDSIENLPEIIKRTIILWCGSEDR